jgi:hypothetical protein
MDVRGTDRSWGERVGWREKRNGARRRWIAGAIGLSLFCCAARGQTISWNATSGSWTDPTKWSPQDVPDQAGDHALFASPTADNADATLASPITIGTLTMSAAQPQLTIQATGNLTVGVASISSTAAQVIVQNNGQLNATSFSTNSTTTINAGGQLTATHYVQTSTTESVISGTLNASAGSIELNEGNLTGDNGGVIRAGTITVSDQSELTMRNGAELLVNAFSNNGQLRLDNGRVTSTNTIQVNSGFVIGAGTLSGAQMNDFAVFNPGSRTGPTVNVGDLHVTGNLAFTTTDTTLQTDITATGHDTVHVDGNAVLTTFLVAPVAGSFIPATGSDYVILTATTLDSSGIEYDHIIVNSQDRVLISNDDGEIGSFELVDRLNGLGGEELVLSDFRPVPEPVIGWALFLGSVLLSRRTRRG